MVAHRRAGKTVACVMELVTRALATPKKDARYAYIAPFFSQAKNVAWDYLKRYAAPVATRFSESELSVDLINGSRIRLFGADNPNALRGMYLDGVVLDEYADMRPGLWGEVIRPLLTDRKGWAIFIGTPKGRNAFYKLIYGDEHGVGAINDPEWFTLTLRASETGILSAEELRNARKSMTEAQYEQEFECSFEAAIVGAIYAKELKRSRAGGRIRSVPYEPGCLVFTAWDLGRGDSTAIWFFQWVGPELRVIDYYENSDETVPHYMGVLKGRGYNYDTLYLPHDADHLLMGSEKSIAAQVRANGFHVEIVPNMKIEHGINQARLLIGKCFFDAQKCKDGLEALTHYQWDYSLRLDEVKAIPLHNWASHGADAFRYLALMADWAIPNPGWGKKLQYDSRGII